MGKSGRKAWILVILALAVLVPSAWVQVQFWFVSDDPKGLIATWESGSPEAIALREGQWQLYERLDAVGAKPVLNHSDVRVADSAGRDLVVECPPPNKSSYWDGQCAKRVRVSRFNETPYALVAEFFVKQSGDHTIAIARPGAVVGMYRLTDAADMANAIEQISWMVPLLWATGLMGAVATLVLILALSSIWSQRSPGRTLEPGGGATADRPTK